MTQRSAATAPPASRNPLAVPFSEVRHEQPEDCLYCEAIAVRGALHQWTIPPHRHEGLHQFQWLDQGSAEVTIDGVAQTVQAPVGLMLAAGAVHGFVYAPHSAGQQVTVPTALLRQALAGATALAARLDHCLVLPSSLPAAAQVEALFTALREEFEAARPGRSEALRAQVALLALWFLRQAGSVPPDEHRQAQRDTLVQRFRALLELQYRRQQPVAFYANSLGVSADHLSRACRAVLGQSALALVQERVTLEARRLLGYTELPVAQIAATLGYDDAGYFSRVFTRQQGMSPSAYRVALLRGVAAAPQGPVGRPAVTRPGL